jgi:hypothetical protein
VRLYLPTGGETWFFVEKSLTVGDFLKQLQMEDQYLKEVSLLGKGLQSLSLDSKVYDALIGEDPLFVQLNDSIHEVPLAQQSITSS